MGLIFTFHLQGRTDALHIYGPKGLDEIVVVQLKYSESRLNYVIHFHLLETEGEMVFENEDLTVSTLAMNHRIPCFGFVFREKQRKYKLIREMLPADLSKENILDLKEGNDITDLSGKYWANHQLATPPPIPRTYVYCSDTRYLDTDVEEIRNADLLYHEATFLSDMQTRAENTHHTTAAEAGRFAARHQVKTLLIGHYSSRYYDLNPFLEEAQTEFSHTILAIEGQTYPVRQTPVPESLDLHA